MLKTEGLVEKKITYMKQIKYSHATRTSYLCRSIRTVSKQLNWDNKTQRFFMRVFNQFYVITTARGIVIIKI